MNGALELNDLSPKFDDPELSDQQTFRAMVKALDHPGQPVSIKSRISVPEILNPASAAMLLMLSHDDSTVWADLDWNRPLIEWFQYQCGCAIVTEPCMASLALITKPLTMPPLNHFRIGNQEQPEYSTTLIVQVGGLSADPSTSPVTSSLNQVTTRSLQEIPLNFWDHWYEQSIHYPLSFDLFLTCDDILAVIPPSIG